MRKLLSHVIIAVLLLLAGSLTAGAAPAATGLAEGRSLAGPTQICGAISWRQVSPFNVQPLFEPVYGRYEPCTASGAGVAYSPRDRITIDKITDQGEYRCNSWVGCNSTWYYDRIFGVWIWSGEVRNA